MIEYRLGGDLTPSCIIDNMGWELAGEFYFPASHRLVAEPELLKSQLEALTISCKEFVQAEKSVRIITRS
ncbi:MAG: hypothetical protein GY702_06475 [Desulfobulbaceae bacterium]|nr:hypothetical protein [Desulfobulbaceae bacterium]